MVSRRARIFTTVVAVIAVLSTMSVAAEIVGTVSAIDDKGMATIKTTEGKELQVRMTGVKVGDKVDCHPKGEKMSCHKLGSKHK